MTDGWSATRRWLCGLQITGTKQLTWEATRQDTADFVAECPKTSHAAYRGETGSGQVERHGTTQHGGICHQSEKAEVLFGWLKTIVCHGNPDRRNFKVGWARPLRQPLTTPLRSARFRMRTRL